MAESNKATPQTPRRHSLSQSKRPRGSPTFLTPHRPQKRVPLRELDSPLFSQRRLENEAPAPRGNTWTGDKKIYVVLLRTIFPTSHSATGLASTPQNRNAIKSARYHVTLNRVLDPGFLLVKPHPKLQAFTLTSRHYGLRSLPLKS